jgi:o-succinylbenzoate---CoA ligase
MWFAHDPSAVAVETPEGALTYADLATASPAARTLRADPRVEFVQAFFGALGADVGVVLVDPRWSERERAAVPDPPSRGVLVHTSGTTGRPRPVVLTRENLMAGARATNAFLGLAPGDRWLAPLPLAHVAGLMVLVRCALAGGTAVLGAPALTGATYVSLVPTQLKRLLDVHPRPSERPAQVILGGAPAPRALLERAARAGVPVRVAYGLTQTSAQVTLSEPGDLQTAGRPLPGARIAIAADGEIVVRGPMVTGSEAHTGDLGHLDPDGRLVVDGRRDDLIVTGGENVMPGEVEEVLLAHPAVAEAVVYARPDPEWGQAVIARVVPRPGGRLETEELRAHCAEALARFKVPKRIEFATELPRTDSGKLLRTRLA